MQAPAVTTACLLLTGVHSYSRNYEFLTQIVKEFPDTDEAAFVGLVRDNVLDVNEKIYVAHIAWNVAFLIVATTKVEASRIPLCGSEAFVDNVHE